MQETTHHEEARYQLFEKLLRAGHSVKPDQIRTCPHCEGPYRVMMKDGSSRNHCAEEACRLAATGIQKQEQNRQRSARYRQVRKVLPWQHDKSRSARRHLQQQIAHASFEYA